MYNTMAAYFWLQVERSSSRTAMLLKRDGTYEPRTWAEVGADVRKLAVTLRELGVEPGACVAQVSENRYEWIVADLALLTLGAIHVPIHSTLSGPQIGYQIRHCGTRCVLVSTPEQAAKIDAVASELSEEIAWLAYDPAVTHIAGRAVRPCRAVLDSPDPSSIVWHPGRPEDIATILYTSGTTGEPKGVMLTQDNLVSNALGVLKVLPQSADDLRLCFLPLSHIFARTCDLYSWVVAGTTLALAESRLTVVADANLVRPTVLNAVPYFYDRIARAIMELGKGGIPGSINELLGGRIRILCGGGAALPEHLFDFFEAQGTPVLQGYGLTETSPVISVSTPAAYRRGASGRPIADVEVRSAEDGEILSRGPHIMAGYYKDPASTSQAIRDGWFHTGDLGHVDEDGFVFITGRKKELIVTLGGKNVAPVLLETLLTEDPLILQAMVIGDGRKYLSALIVPDEEQLSACFPQASRPLDLARADVRAVLAARVAERLTRLSHHEQVKRFTLISQPFTIERGELTPKLTLRREIIARQYAAEIAALYDDSAA